MPDTPQVSSGSLSPSSDAGSRTISIHTEREVKIFAVHEPELDTLSYLNTATTALFAIGALFLPYFLENIREGKDGYVWYGDPFCWAAIGLFCAASFAVYVKKGIIGKIKQESKNRGRNDNTKGSTEEQEKT